MIGLVVVSHSRALGQAAAVLAQEMVPAEHRPALRVAAGLDDTTFGTDATAIAEAITAVDSPDGVLVLVDLGSAILSAEMALEFVEPGLAARTVISPAPLIEGLVAAVVTASTGASLSEVGAEAHQGLLAKQQQLDPSQEDPPQADAPQPPDGDDWLAFSWTIRNPHGLHARPAATLVSSLQGIDAEIRLVNATTARGPASARSLSAVQALGLRKSDILEAQITGPQAEQALSILTSLAKTDFGESATPATPTASTAPAPSGCSAPPASERTGLDIVIAPAHHLCLDPDLSSYSPADPATETNRLNHAMAVVVSALHELGTDKDQAIYQVQELTLTEEETQRGLHEAIRAGSSAIEAVTCHFDALAADLDTIDDPYLAARAEDQRGLKRLLLRALVGEPVSPTPPRGILILDELDPVTAGGLDPASCEGIITTSGGATGHGGILAAARGFPLLTGRKDAAAIPDGTPVAIDPVEHQLWISPDETQIKAIRLRQEQRATQAADAARHCHEPALTCSGQRILVEANIACVDDASRANEAGAEGSGLVRTEVLFEAWTHAPTVEEQAEIFTQIATALSGRTITIRTWDPGGDKPLSFLPQAPEANPMLGERGIRAMRRLPDLLTDQLTAILIASKVAPLRVMFPMIAVPESMVWARVRLEEARRSVGGEVSVGMMVETPAAALRAHDFLDLADFISIGTNDLTQYTMAVDRGNPVVASVAQADTSAVWDLIGCAARAFAGRPVAVCGDLASQPKAVPRLIHLGVTELSVRPPLVGAIKQAVRSAE